MNNDTKSGGGATGTGSASATGKKAVHVKVGIKVENTSILIYELWSLS